MIIQSALSLPDQLNLFKEYVGRIKAAVREEQAAATVAESLYVVVCGSDDIANTYFSTTVRRAHYDIPSYINLMVDYASSFFQVYTRSLFPDKNSISSLIHWVFFGG